ncbi:MAG: FAD-dependent oxidoreductase [Bacteroidales bacterium]|nr:FAD-dependent oxidoreductase [Bacteroidales bacterium]MDT8430851.1 FAD-dependent oxidoreductase [Bacteroidales bacterium]
MRIAVIGGGPAGLTAAYQLSKELGKSVETLDVYEASDVVGGMSRSIRLWNQTVDLGPHRFFSKDKRINTLWLEVVGEDFHIVQRKTRIFYNKTFFDYPIRAFNALKGLGIWEATLCMASYFKQKVVPVKDTSTFEGWVTSRFGSRLYRIFFKTYSEKLWGIKCTELDSDFASQRIKKLSLFEAVKNALVFRNSSKHATLVEQFAYPVNGTGSVYTKMMDKITARGGKVHLGTPVEKVVTAGNNAQAIRLENGQEISYDHIVSTMPLTLLADRLGTMPEALTRKVQSLKFRNTILVYLQVDRTDLFPDQWLYIHDAEVETGRITNFRNWVPRLYGDRQQSVLCLEYWCNFEDERWSTEDATLMSLARKEITKIGLAAENEILDAYVFRIPRCYPVYFSGYQEMLKPVQEFLGKINNLHVIGRYGAYKYNNQDHSILMGMLAAENILTGAGHDLWEINTDYEVYQESATITKTGLKVTSGN